MPRPDPDPAPSSMRRRAHSLSDWLAERRDGSKAWLETSLTPVAAALHRQGLRPDHVSWAGLGLSAIAAGLVAAGHLASAAVVFLAAGCLDLLDGILARSTGSSSRFGAFLDSTLDRASEGLILAAIGYRLARDGAAVEVAVVVLALLGSLLVSYTRARAEALGAVCEVGIATRAERVVLIAAGLLSGALAVLAYVLALLSAVTVVQRIREARRELGRSPP